MKLFIGPTGYVSKGHVLDVAQKPFERALKDHDPLLYVKWNPAKVKGHGCWEIRRRPEQLSISDITQWKGGAFIKLDYVENNLINHVLDAAFLNYDQLRKIKEMDVWSNYNSTKHFVDQIEQGEDDRHNAQVKKALSESRYVAKQYKKEIRAFKEFVLSGGNPAEIARYWDQDSEL